ncbi:asparaginase domain-containing protein [Actinomadura sp. DC4]|uniref:asparaginase domain-containing protein n=1 Tax=Actinomadura sp. DC4 TaxID=3055069 RepID=UPI0025B12CAA|nr:asparaginase domain-containing protein [Actinomadura sp. DC4]MDN3353286.1 asparaginase domain-containing protein [Actinomadura sp. DC4]
MTVSPGPPPWPLPPSWTLTPPRQAETTEELTPPAPEPVAPEPVVLTAHRTIALLAPDDAGAREVLGAVPGVKVDTRTVRTPSPGFAGVYELADAAARAMSEGADGVVIVQGADAPEETAWALDLLHPGDAPLVLAADPGHAGDVADAISVAAAAPPRSGCLLVARGEIHAARHVRRTGSPLPELTSPGAGPLGHVTDGTVRLLWRPPERITVRDGANGGRVPRVGLHTAVLGDDGLLLGALAERCDGLVVAAATTGGVPEEIALVLAEASARMPVVVASPVGYDSIPMTSLDPLKARVLMHLLLAAGRGRDAVLAAFAAAERPGPAQL